MKYMGCLYALLDIASDGNEILVQSKACNREYIIYRRHGSNLIYVEWGDFDSQDKTEEQFWSYRNGDATYPCMERYLDKWAETVNSPDCEFYIF
jgi:hypothetical protein